MRLKKLTELLLEKNTQSLKYFNTYHKKDDIADFKETILPFADEVKKLSDEWLELAMNYVKNFKPKYLHSHQMEDAHENIQIQSVTCFQRDTKKRRFLEQNKSIDFTLSGLNKELT
nr:DUF1798 family protein [Evansella tamaricis]